MVVDPTAGAVGYFLSPLRGWVGREAWVSGFWGFPGVCSRRAKCGDGGAEGPVESCVVDFEEEAVGAGVEVGGDGVAGGVVGAAGFVGMDQFTVEPGADAVVAADSQDHVAGG